MHAVFSVHSVVPVRKVVNSFVVMHTHQVTAVYTKRSNSCEIMRLFPAGLYQKMSAINRHQRKLSNITTCCDLDLLSASESNHRQ